MSTQAAQAWCLVFSGFGALLITAAHAVAIVMNARRTKNMVTPPARPSPTTPPQPIKPPETKP
jgi:hypothetical protein